MLALDAKRPLNDVHVPTFETFLMILGLDAVKMHWVSTKLDLGSGSEGHTIKFGSSLDLALKRRRNWRHWPHD